MKIKRTALNEKNDIVIIDDELNIGDGVTINYYSDEKPATIIEIDTKGAKHKRVDKKATSYGAITGKWTENVLFDNEVFWNREDNVLLDMIEPEYKLPSDSCFRSDLKIFLTGKEDEAQEEKEKLEENQRRDRRLREGTDKENQKEEKD